MLNKFLKDVVVVVVGKQAEDIADLLESKKHVNEFIIAKKLGITINQTRNILYKLSDYGLVSSIRKKDKKKGWYTYFWKIETLKALEFLKGIIDKKISEVANQMKSREIKTFYICERCNIELTEENALFNDFTCNECGGIFTLRDNTKVIKDFKRNLDRLEKEKSLLEEEIQKEMEKYEKQRIKDLKKEEKEKAAKKKSKKTTKKITKKSVKKSAQKKVKKVVKRVAKKKAVKKTAKKKVSKKLKKKGKK